MLNAYKQQLQDVAKTLGIPEPQDWFATLMRLPEAIKTDTGNTELEGR